MDQDTIDRMIRLEVLKQVSALKEELTRNQPASTIELRADDWDFKCEAIEQYPGPVWQLHCIMGPDNHGRVYACWRMRRTEQAVNRLKAHMEIK